MTALARIFLFTFSLSWIYENIIISIPNLISTNVKRMFVILRVKICIQARHWNKF